MKLKAVFFTILALFIFASPALADDPPLICEGENVCVDLGASECSVQNGVPGPCVSTIGSLGTCCLPVATPIPQPQPPGPFPEEYIECGSEDDTVTPEFHSLRPYQASPCLKELQELDLYCGNDFITVKTYDVTPNDAQECFINTSGGLTCNFEFDEEVRIGVELPDAELPIMGNTQLVSNQVNSGVPSPERYEWPRLVNEYLSWWLNGTTYRAEDYLHFHPGVRPDTMAIVDYGGPIKKLFPQSVMWSSRTAQQVAVTHSDPQFQRHNQIYECKLGNDQAPCWFDFSEGRYEDANGNPLSFVRLRGGGATVESPYMPFVRTEDRLGMVFIGNDLTNSFPKQPTSNEGQEVNVTNLDFATLASGDLLYFPHMREGSDLVDHLQKTYVPRGEPRSVFVGWGEGVDQYNTYRCDLEDVRWNSGDDMYGELGAHLPEAVEVPETGEQLTGESIQAIVSYHTDFQCEWNQAGEPCPNTSGFCQVGCLDPCQNDPGDGNYQYCTPLIPPQSHIYPDRYGCCLDRCEVELRCQKDALTASSIYTRSPLTQEIWDRTVDGKMSLMKKVLPKIGVFGMFNEWKDWPAVTSAQYGVIEDIQGGPGDYSTLAGDPLKRRPGGDAEIYIPHLGGMKIFAMTFIQDTLRPKVMNSGYTASGPGGNGPPPGSGSPGGQCSVGVGLCSPENLSPPWSQGPEANAASQICQRESGANPNALNTSCLRCSDNIDNDSDGLVDLDDPNCDSATADYSVGLFQINLHPLATFTPRCPGAFEMSYSANNTGSNPLNWCRVIDQDALNDCVDEFIDPANNIAEAYDLYNDSNTWCSWGTAAPPPVGCGLCQQ